MERKESIYKNTLFKKDIAKCKNLIEFFRFLQKNPDDNEYFKFLAEFNPDIIKQYKNDIKKYDLFYLDLDELLNAYVQDWIESELSKCGMNINDILKIIIEVPKIYLY
jgi:hypothetical protein